MKTNMIRVFTLVAALSVSAIAFAQNKGVLRATVPFAFMVGDQKMPAGDYVVEANGEGGLMVLHCYATGQSAIVLTEAGTPKIDASAGLTFERRGNEVHLVRIQDSGGPARLLAVNLR